MELIRAEKQQISEIVEMSKAAFDSDVNVGAKEAGGPPEYDSVSWHTEMMEQGHLFSLVEDNKLVGVAILFKDEKNPTIMYVGRIFISPVDFRKGYGMKLSELIEDNNPDCKVFKLDTPIWNTRTNRFYQKMGYVEERRDKEFVYYVKRK